MATKKTATAAKKYIILDEYYNSDFPDVFYDNLNSATIAAKNKFAVSDGGEFYVVEFIKTITHGEPVARDGFFEKED